jgi:hypothetical protein
VLHVFSHVWNGEGVETWNWKGDYWSVEGEKREGEEQKKTEGVNMINPHYMQVQKCHNKTPQLYNLKN